MKKLLSVFCVIALLTLCISGVFSVSANEFYTETFIQDEYVEILDAPWGDDGTGNPYLHHLNLPIGYEWQYTGGDAGGTNWQANDDVPSDRMRVSLYTAADEKTYMQRTGGDISVTKMVDIVPGYSYTVSSNAFTKSALAGAGRASLEYWLYHKNDDGKYIPINEYLASVNANTIADTSAYSYYNLLESGIETEWDEASAKTELVSISFNVTEEAVNAVKIGLGGYSQTNSHIMHATFYDGFKIEQGNEVLIKENKPAYYKEMFGKNYTNIPFSAEYEGVSYDGLSADVPEGWGYSADGLYPIQATANKQFAKFDTYSYPEGAIVMYGSFVSLTKMISVEPGYNYTVRTNAAVWISPGSDRADTMVELYHKNDDGTYTKINEYLAENNFQNKSLDNAQAHTYVDSPSKANDPSCPKINPDSPSNEYVDITYDVSFSVTDKNADAVMIKLGGRNGQGVNNSAAYRGITVFKGDAVEIIPNYRPPYLTLETAENETHFVRYTPKADENPTIVIAAYEIGENGELELIRTLVAKNEKTSEGYFEAPYDMEFLPEDNVTVKAFAWNMEKNMPLAKTLTIR